MGTLRRILLSLALVAGLVPATSFAQPAPVPALPDSERRTSYSISGTTCACNVNFALYGDSTDYQNWIEVWLNGVNIAFNDSTKGWTVTSPSGPLSSLARPITNAVLTFNSVQTGTVQIVGATRPRRTVQFTEGGVTARNLNVALTYIVASLREFWDKLNDVTGRAVQGLPGETIAPLPSIANRANQVACFDAFGNMVTCASVPGTTFGAGTGISLTGSGPVLINTNLSAGAGIAITGTAPQVLSELITQRVITAAGGVTVVAADDQILINKSVPATTTVTLPAASTRGGRPLVVKDLARNAAAFNITLTPNGAETIDGAANLVISINGSEFDLVPISGTGWAIK